MANPPTQPGFFGANPVAFRIESDGSLKRSSDPLSPGLEFSSSSTPIVQIKPMWFNAPGQVFEQQNKPAAFASVSMSQRSPLKPMASSLSWSVVYSLISAANQDIVSQDFTLDDADADKLSNIPLPGGRGKISCPVYAVVGGENPRSLLPRILNVFNTLQTIAGGNAARALFTIPAADSLVFAQATALLEEIIQITSAPQYTQYWINSNPVELTVSTAGVGVDILSLARGVSQIVIIPSRGNAPEGVAPVDYLQNVTTSAANNTEKFQLTPNGIKKLDGSNSLFDDIPYIALTAEVDDA